MSGPEQETFVTALDDTDRAESPSSSPSLVLEPVEPVVQVAEADVQPRKQTSLAARMKAVWLTAHVKRQLLSRIADEDPAEKQSRLRQRLEDAFESLAASHGIAPAHLYPLVYCGNAEIQAWSHAKLTAAGLSTRALITLCDMLGCHHPPDARGPALCARTLRLWSPPMVLALARCVAFAALVPLEVATAASEMAVRMLWASLLPVGWVRHPSLIRGVQCVSAPFEALVTCSVPLIDACLPSGHAQSRVAMPCYPHDAQRDPRTEVRVSCRVTQVHELNARAHSFTASLFLDITWRLDARRIPYLAQMIRLIGSEPHREYRSVAEKLLRKGAGQLDHAQEPMLSVLAAQLSEDPHLLWNPQIELRNLETPERQERWYQVYRDTKARPAQPLPEDALLLISERRRVRQGVFSSHFYMGEFPVDRHELVLQLRSRRQSHEVHLTNAGLVSRWHSHVSTAHFAQRAEWNLSPSVTMYELETEPSESSNALVYPECHLALRISRRPGTYVWDVLVPNSCICVLALSSFALRFTSSSGAGDRLSLVLVAVLSFFNFKSTPLMQDLPRTSNQSTMDCYLLGCFAFLVLVMLCNALVIIGAESHEPCDVHTTTTTTDGTSEDLSSITAAAVWKEQLLVLLDHWVYTWYRLPIGAPSFDAALDTCSRSGVNTIRFERLNESFAFVAFALLLAMHVLLVLWLSHRVVADARWLREAPLLNAWRPSQAAGAQTHAAGLASSACGDPTPGGGGEEEPQLHRQQPKGSIAGGASASVHSKMDPPPPSLLAAASSTSAAAGSSSSSPSPREPPSPAPRWFRVASRSPPVLQPRRFSTAQQANATALARELSSYRGQSSRHISPSQRSSSSAAWAQLLSLASHSSQHARAYDDEHGQMPSGSVWPLSVNRVLSGACGQQHAQVAPRRIMVPGDRAAT